MPRNRIWSQKACFTTHVVRGHASVFRATPYFDVICGALEFYRAQYGLRLFGYVIMPDHMHLLSGAGTNGDLAHMIHLFRRYTAKGILGMLRTEKKQWLLDQLRIDGGPEALWETDYRPIDASGCAFEQKLNYIHMNPVRRGFVSRAEHWRYSSAGYCILKEPGPVGIDSINEPPGDDAAL